MKYFKLLGFIYLISLVCSTKVLGISYNKIYTFEKSKPIIHPQTSRGQNIWVSFSSQKYLPKLKKGPSIAYIATDTKYWLWVNGKLVVFEGGLKWGPSPTSGYVDTVNLSPHLKIGKNQIDILVWHFGKDGFSHKNTGLAFLQFENKDYDWYSDTSWKSKKMDAYYTNSVDGPNFRLAESHVCFNANKSLEAWQGKDLHFKTSQKVLTIDSSKNYVVRPIPHWINYGLKTFNLPHQQIKSKPGVKYDTLWLKLPYNMQCTPFLSGTFISSKDTVIIFTDSYRTDTKSQMPNTSIRAEYIPRKGTQSYESLGWMSGDNLYFVLPKSAKIKSLGYRETGFATSIVGYLRLSDPFFDTLFQKAARTLYVNMRDNYFDCPDRERAQWWGDAILEMEQSFVMLSQSSWSLIKKAYLENLQWGLQKGTFYGPIPSGNWDSELPLQMLLTFSELGLKNYVFNTDDFSMYTQYYDTAIPYLLSWQVDTSGLVKHKKGGWDWADWGENQDIELIETCLYYMALKGAIQMADALLKTADAQALKSIMKRISSKFQTRFYQNGYYKSPTHIGDVDDRGNALAVVADLAPKHTFDGVTSVLGVKHYASPYMERFVIEALFMMNKENEAINRVKLRYENMVKSNHSTLWEVWDIGQGTFNHAWAGGIYPLMLQYIAGFRFTEPARNLARIEPKLDLYPNIAFVVPVKNNSKIEFTSKKSATEPAFNCTLTTPILTNLIFRKNYLSGKEISVNGTIIYSNGKQLTRKITSKFGENVTCMVIDTQEYLAIPLLAGSYNLSIR